MNFDNTPADPVGLLASSWAPVRVAVTPWDANPLAVANGSTVDGVVLATGDRFVVVGERDDAGIYTVGASSSARAVDANEAGEFVPHRRVRVLEGSADNIGTWVLRTTEPVVLGTTNLVFSFLAAFDEEIPAQGFDNTPAVPVSTASATTIYYGTAEYSAINEAQAKSELLSRTQATATGTFTCLGLGYKYLAVPAAMPAPSMIRDHATGFAMPLAAADDGYTQTTSGLTHRSLSIDGVGYRLYRSANQLNSDITLETA